MGSQTALTRPARRHHVTAEPRMHWQYLFQETPEFNAHTHVKVTAESRKFPRTSQIGHERVEEDPILPPQPHPRADYCRRQVRSDQLAACLAAQWSVFSCRR